MARLRGPGGCPWDPSRPIATLARHLLEETHELLEAIDAGDDDGIRDELGDLLLQVAFHAQIAADDGRWDVDDVADGLVAKLVHRHPHVFGDIEVVRRGRGARQLGAAQGRGGRAGGRGVDEDIPASLPALARAAKVQRRAAGWGFEWRTADGALEAPRRARRARGRRPKPASAEEELGDVLLAAVAVARTLGVDAETALRRTGARFARSLRAVPSVRGRARTRRRGRR